MLHIFFRPSFLTTTITQEVPLNQFTCVRQGWKMYIRHYKLCALQEKTISRGVLFPPGSSKIPFSLNNKGTWARKMRGRSRTKKAPKCENKTGPFNTKTLLLHNRISFSHSSSTAQGVRQGQKTHICHKHGCIQQPAASFRNTQPQFYRIQNDSLSHKRVVFCLSSPICLRTQHNRFCYLRLTLYIKESSSIRTKENRFV